MFEDSKLKIKFCENLDCLAKRDEFKNLKVLYFA